MFEGFWSRLEALIEEGRARCPDEVMGELEPIDDELLAWARAHRQVFEPWTAEIWDASREIAREFPDLCNWDKEVPEADPFVVAIALVRRRRSLALNEDCDWSVVTTERRPRGKTGIPEACAYFDIPVLDLVGFFAQEGLRAG